MRAVATVVLAATLAFGAGAATIGCSSHSTTTTRTVEQRADGESAVKTETTTTEKDDDDDGGGGIISGTIDAIGFILALPFKIVGGLIEIIF